MFVNFTETSLIMLIIFLVLIFVLEYEKIMIFLMTTFKSTYWQHQISQKASKRT